VRKKPQGDHLFKKGNPGGPGRPKGSQDRFTREIKQAIVEAAGSEDFVGAGLRLLVRTVYFYA
jgi:hypothetical protein